MLVRPLLKNVHSTRLLALAALLGLLLGFLPPAIWPVGGAVPDYPEGGTFPVDEAAPRARFARLLWTAIQGSPAAP